MLGSAASYMVTPAIALWVWRQERSILTSGLPLDALQQEDARRVGVQFPERVRLRIVDNIPPRLHPMLRTLCRRCGLANTVGMCLRYGIYLDAEYWGDRSVLVHELAHTAQYERAGGISRFLRQYLKECFTVGYQHSQLEQEAERLSREVCKN